MPAIAIDGPAGAGKSTLARAIAHQLGYLYVDTGALYRAIALFCQRRGLAAGQEQEVQASLSESQILLAIENGVQQVFLGEEEVSSLIRSPEIAQLTSDLSALPCVRTYLLELQRNLARRQSVVMDGRDIGTVVLPDAAVKIFLVATPEERARRRMEDFAQKGIPADFATVLAQINQRDLQDSTRATAPLKKAEDANEYDTTGETLEQSLEGLCVLIKERLSHVGL